MNKKIEIIAKIKIKVKITSKNTQNKKISNYKNIKPHKSFLKCGYTSKKSKNINFLKIELFEQYS